jgi:hypothetical protein
MSIKASIFLITGEKVTLRKRLFANKLSNEEYSIQKRTLSNRLKLLQATLPVLEKRPGAGRSKIKKQYRKEVI